jgi:hypothetical protein
LTRPRQHLKNLAFIVNSAPKARPLAINANEDLIKMLDSQRSHPAGSHPGCDRRSKLQNPSMDRFIADTNAAFVKHVLDVSKAQRKAKAEPDGPLEY